METLSTDVAHYLLDLLHDPADLVRVHRLCKRCAEILNQEYWCHRVAILLHLSISPTSGILWNITYRELTTVTPESYLLILLGNNLPKPVILDWVAANRPILEWQWLIEFSRFDLVVDLIRLSDPEYPDYQSISRYPHTPYSIGVQDFFYNLISTPTCPLEVLRELEDTYHLLRLAFELFANTEGQDSRLTQFLDSSQNSALSLEQQRTRLKLVLSYLPMFSLASRYAVTVLKAVIALDSVMLLTLLLKKYSSHNQEWISMALWERRLKLQPRLVRYVVDSLSLLQVQKELNDILFSYCLVHSDFYAILFQHSSITNEVLITRIMPKVSVAINTSIRVNVRNRCMQGAQGKYDYKMHQAIRLWQQWGIVELDIFLDPRTLQYVDSFYDTLYLLSLLPYSNDSDSDYFSVLCRLPSWKVPFDGNDYHDDVLAKYMNN
jgi:hypothetical protein